MDRRVYNSPLQPPAVKGAQDPTHSTNDAAVCLWHNYLPQPVRPITAETLAFVFDIT